MCLAALRAGRSRQYTDRNEPFGLRHHAVIHDHEQACLLRSFGGLRMTHAFLHPGDLGPKADGLINDVRYGLGAPEDVHHIDRFWYRQQIAIGLFSQDLGQGGGSLG